jgi:predicted SprT family Zn-dependent metalloprotease
MTIFIDVECKGCNEMKKITRAIQDEVGGRYYCIDCQDEAPDDYPLAN